MSKLVAMSKDGETIGVHSTLVGAHERVGWKVGGDLPEVEVAQKPDSDVATNTAPGKIARKTDKAAVAQ